MKNEFGEWRKGRGEVKEGERTWTDEGRKDERVEWWADKVERQKKEKQHNDFGIRRGNEKGED